MREQADPKNQTCEDLYVRADMDSPPPDVVINEVDDALIHDVSRTRHDWNWNYLPSTPVTPR